MVLVGRGYAGWGARPAPPRAVALEAGDVGSLCCSASCGRAAMVGLASVRAGVPLCTQLQWAGGKLGDGGAVAVDRQQLGDQAVPIWAQRQPLGIVRAQVG